MKYASVLTIVILLFASLAAMAQELRDRSCDACPRSNRCSDVSNSALQWSSPLDKQPLTRVERGVQP
jgi:hypothetical protein